MYKLGQSQKVGKLNDPTRVFQCPSDTGMVCIWPVYSRLPTAFKSGGTSYIYNASSNDNGENYPSGPPDGKLWGLQARRIGEVWNPTRAVMASDLSFTAYSLHPFIGGQPFLTGYWHHRTVNGWGNVGFVDGHVSFLLATAGNPPSFPNYQVGENFSFKCVRE